MEEKYGNYSGHDFKGATLQRLGFSPSKLKLDFSGANLGRCVISNSSMHFSNFAGADLNHAQVISCELMGADFTGADLTGATFRDCVLSVAIFYLAKLDGTTFDDCRFDDADLRGCLGMDGAVVTDMCDVDDAVLTERDAEGYKVDVWRVLDQAPAEAEAVLAALQAGKVNGSAYQGPCACLVGTIANARGQTVDDLVDIEPDIARPAERWFLPVRPGQTPENNRRTAELAAWIEEWFDARGRWRSMSSGPLPAQIIGWVQITADRGLAVILTAYVEQGCLPAWLDEHGSPRLPVAWQRCPGPPPALHDSLE